MTNTNTALPQLLSADDVAEAAHVPEYQVKKWCREGVFPRAFKVGGRTSPWFIPAEEAIAFLRGELVPNTEDVDLK
jgi:hypothetical protein